MKPIAWGANPSKVTKKGKKHMAKKKGHPKKTGASKGHNKGGEKRNPSKGHKKGEKHKRNPGVMGKLKSGLGGTVGKGLAIVAGITAAKVVAQNVVPAAYRSGPVGALATAAVGLGAAYLLRKTSFGKKYADMVGLGGVIAATQPIVEPLVLPALSFNLLGEIDPRIARIGMGEIDPRIARVRMLPNAMPQHPVVSQVRRNNGSRLP